MQKIITLVFLALSLTMAAQTPSGYTLVQGNRAYKGNIYFSNAIMFPGSVTLSATDVTNFKTIWSWGNPSSTYATKASPAFTGTLSLTGGGTVSFGTSSITMTGSLGTTGSRLTKGWFTDLQVTNPIAGSITGNAANVTGTVAVANGGTGLTSGYNKTQWDDAVTRLSDTIALTEIALLVEDSTITYPTLYQLNSGLNLKAPKASPDFTGGQIGLTNSTYTGTLYFGSKNTSLNHSAGDEAYYNVFVGINSGANLAKGSYNTGIGSDIMTYSTTSTNNSALGYGALHGITTTGTDNTGMGYNAGTQISTGDFNTTVGSTAGYGITTGLYNTCVGAGSGFTNNKSYGVFIGFQAGYYETGDNKLFIDNTKRASESDARTKSLVYGVFDASTSNQAITFNALKVYLPYLPTYADNAAALSGGLTAGQVYKTSTGVLMIVY